MTHWINDQLPDKRGFYLVVCDDKVYISEYCPSLTRYKLEWGVDPKVYRQRYLRGVTSWASIDDLITDAELTYLLQSTRAIANLIEWHSKREIAAIELNCSKIAHSHNARKQTLIDLHESLKH